MPRKTGFSQKSTAQQTTKSPLDQIEEILKLYKTDPPKARIAVEKQARKIWLQYLFQQHKETVTTVEVEEVEERQQIFGGGNPDGEIITNRKTKKTTTKTTIPRVPIPMMKAALTFDWSVSKKFVELEALSLCIDAGLIPESAKDVIEDYSSGFGEKVIESMVIQSDNSNALPL